MVQMHVRVFQKMALWEHGWLIKADVEEWPFTSACPRSPQCPRTYHELGKELVKLRNIAEDERRSKKKGRSFLEWILVIMNES